MLKDVIDTLGICIGVEFVYILSQLLKNLVNGHYAEKSIQMDLLVIGQYLFCVRKLLSYLNQYVLSNAKIRD